MAHSSTIGVLLSGGLDSSVLAAELLRRGHRVQPFYVRSGLYWEREELAALRAFLRAIASRGLLEAVVLDLPLADLYGAHWSVDGREPPGAETADRAVYLPGRNALLAIKPAIWCGLNGVRELALAVLAGNPFADATDGFFRGFEAALEQATGKRVAVVRPFAGMTKDDVVRLGRDLPLELTCSCIAPREGLHCGRCNKCAERQRAFRTTGIRDPTIYASQTANIRD
jgi:7-cyano-7-deazaguanine synthase